jgi:hypothetical protein
MTTAVATTTTVATSRNNRHHSYWTFLFFRLLQWTMMQILAAAGAAGAAERWQNILLKMRLLLLLLQQETIPLPMTTTIPVATITVKPESFKTMGQEGKFASKVFPFAAGMFTDCATINSCPIVALLGVLSISTTNTNLSQSRFVKPSF